MKKLFLLIILVISFTGCTNSISREEYYKIENEKNILKDENNKLKIEIDNIEKKKLEDELNINNYYISTTNKEIGNYTTEVNQNLFLISSFTNLIQNKSDNEISKLEMDSIIDLYTEIYKNLPVITSLYNASLLKYDTSESNKNRIKEEFSKITELLTNNYGEFYSTKLEEQQSIYDYIKSKEKVMIDAVKLVTKYINPQITK